MALAGPLPYPVAWKIAEGTYKEAGLTVTPFPLKHRVPCCGYRLHLPRAGRFDAARAKAAGIPLEYWRVLQAGQSIGGFAPGDVLGPPRRGLTVVYATDTPPDRVYGIPGIVQHLVYTPSMQLEFRPWMVRNRRRHNHPAGRFPSTLHCI